MTAILLSNSGSNCHAVTHGARNCIRRPFTRITATVASLDTLPPRVTLERGPITSPGLESSGMPSSAIDRRGLRHTFADELRRSGADVVTISKLPGHWSIAVTARYLDQLTQRRRGRGAARIKLPPFAS